VLRCLAEVAPVSRVLLGTDYPFAQEIGVALTTNGLRDHAGYDDADRRAIDRDNALTLFPRFG
jgi:predicted TIM-barrel fold metal-dependent hydrolase